MVALLGVMVLIAAGCGATKAASVTVAAGGATISGGTLTAATNGSGPWSPVFNPFSPTYNYAFGFGAVYESLYMYNDKTQQELPWLATSFAWADGGDQITFTIRQGVKWSNGQPFTPADVAFTFGLLNKINAENNATALEAKVSVVGDTVVLKYTTPQYVNFDTIAYNTPMVPPFTFANVGDPLKFEDTHPIGTGPFVLKSATTEYITYTRNPHYWQKGEPYISTVRDVSADSNSSMEALLIAHQIDYSGVFTSDIKRTFVDRAPTQNVVYTPALGTISLALNQADSLFQNVALRQGISEAINRTELSTIGESGAELPASPSGLSGAVASTSIEPQYASPLTPNTTKALSILRSGGFTMKGGKLVDGTSGKQIAFSLEFPGSYSDWMTDCSLLQSQMKTIGINLTCDSVSYNRWVADTSTGVYQASFDPATGPQAYQELEEVFAVGPKGLPAVGQSNDSVNIERFDNTPAVNALAALQKITPTDTAALKKQYDILEAIMVKDVPVIPLFTSTYHADFVDGPLYGWPSTTNSYLCVACDGAQEQLLLNVHESK